MNNIIKVIMRISVVMMVISFSVVLSYSQEKPSEYTMKGIITHNVNRVIGQNLGPDVFKVDIKNIVFNTFQITQSFFKKGSDGKDIYCVEINYEISYTLDEKVGNRSSSKSIKKEGEKYSFFKKSNDWYGRQGWNIE